MRFSVVIPLYNKENYIQRAVQSILAQTEQNFEIVIVDDGSTDNSLVNAKKIKDERIRILSTENFGVSAARNRGILEASNTFIGFLDADDEWTPYFLEKIHLLIDTFPDCGVFASSFQMNNKDGSHEFPNAPYPEYSVIDNIIEAFRLYYPFSSSSVVIRKDQLELIDGFPVGIIGGEDVYTWLKLGLNTNIAYINTPLAIYHKEAENRVCDNVPPYDYYPPANYLSYLLSNGKLKKELRQSATEYVAKHQITSAKRFIRQKLPIKAIRTLWSSRKTKAYRQDLHRYLVIAALSIFIHGLSKRI